MKSIIGQADQCLSYNCICVLSDFALSVAGTIISGEDSFMKWRIKEDLVEDFSVITFDTFF